MSECQICSTCSKDRKHVNQRPHCARRSSRRDFHPEWTRRPYVVALQRGSYSGRGVRYFRVFDAIRVTERALTVRRYADLDARPGRLPTGS